MKLAFCIFRYFPFGGLQQDMLRIARACLSHGHEITVYTMSWQGENILGLNVEIIKVSAHSNHKRAKQFAEQVRTHFQAHDVVLGFNKMPGLDFYFGGDICFQFVKKSHKPLWYRWLPRYRHYVEMESAVFSKHASTHIFLLTEKQKREYQFCYRTPDDRISIVPPGIRRNHLTAAEMIEKRDALRKELNIETGELVWLFVASSFDTKGLDRVIDALGKLHFPGSRLLVIGGDRQDDYRALAGEASVEKSICFLGEKQNVQYYMLAADMLLNPARYESAGMAIIEALTMGLPVILTENCGYAGHVSEADAGIVIPAQFEPEDLVIAMRDAIDPRVRAKWQQNALEYTRDTDLYSLGDTVVRLIEEKHVD